MKNTLSSAVNRALASSGCRVGGVGLIVGSAGGMNVSSWYSSMGPPRFGRFAGVRYISIVFVGVALRECVPFSLAAGEGRAVSRFEGPGLVFSFGADEAVFGLGLRAGLERSRDEFAGFPRVRLHDVVSESEKHRGVIREPTERPGAQNRAQGTSAYA